MWKQLLFAGALACSGSTTCALFIDGCPTGTFPVSVLDDPVVHCLSSAPCSGTYSASGLLQGVGACPSNTGCALLPNNEAIMGCVAAGRGDVTYVNADGSLTRGGKVINLKSTATTTTTTSTTDSSNSANSNNANSGNNANNSNNSGTASTSTTSKGSDSTTSTSSPTATVTPGNLDGADLLKSGGTTSAIGSQDAAASASKKTGSSAAGSSAGLRGSKSSSGSSDSIPSPSPSPTPSPTPSQSVEHVNSQQTLNDIDGDSKTSKGNSSNSAGGFGIMSIIGVVVGCLAIVAVVAGVRLLKKGKEAVVETPEGTLDTYGGGITPKENVVLL